MRSSIELVEGGPAAGPVADAALSHRLLREVAEGRRPETLRLWRPGDALAFSGSDRTREGFARATQEAARAGFPPFLRLTGGHAAVYTREALAFAWAMPVRHFREGVHARFEAVSRWVAGALRRLGVDARVGPVPGEYCPGDHSVNARGRVKLMGVGQRVMRGAALLGGVIVVGGGDRARGVLRPVYAALDLEFAPESVGSVESEIGPCRSGAVRDALAAELAERRPVSAGVMDAATVAAARLLEPRHRIEGTPPAPWEGAKLVVDA